MYHSQWYDNNFVISWFSVFAMDELTDMHGQMPLKTYLLCHDGWLTGKYFNNITSTNMLDSNFQSALIHLTSDPNALERQKTLLEHISYRSTHVFRHCVRIKVKLASSVWLRIIIIRVKCIEFCWILPKHQFIFSLLLEHKSVSQSHIQLSANYDNYWTFNSTEPTIISPSNQIIVRVLSCVWRYASNYCKIPHYPFCWSDQLK